MFLLLNLTRWWSMHEAEQWMLRRALLSVGHIYGMAGSPDLILQGAESGSFTFSTRTGGNWTLGPLPANPFFWLYAFIIKYCIMSFEICKIGLNSHSESCVSVLALSKISPNSRVVLYPYS